MGQLGHVRHLAPQHEAAGLEAADVEQLGDEARHAIRVVVHLLEHHALLLVLQSVPTIEQQRRIALDRRERAAQLVAHGGNDFAAGRLLVRVAPGWAHREHGTAHGAVPVAFVPAGDPHLDVSVDAPDRDLVLGDLRHRAQAGRRVPRLGEERAAVAATGCEHVAQRAADEFARSRAGQPAGGLVGVDDAPLAVEPHDRVGQCVEGHRAHGCVARRWRAASKQITDAAIATFKDSTSPVIGTCSHPSI